MRARTAAWAALACLLIAGCSGGGKKAKEPVAFGTATPDQRKLAVSTTGDTAVPASKWPNACELLTDAEIRGMLPQAANIQRRPTRVKVVHFALRGPQKADEVAPAGRCRYSFELTGATIKDITSSISLGIEAVADPRLISQEYAKQLAGARRSKTDQQLRDQGGQLGPQGCHTYVDGSGTEALMTCRQGPLLFSIGGMGFGTYAGVATDLTARRDHWQQKVQYQVARIVAAKVA